MDNDMDNVPTDSFQSQCLALGKEFTRGFGGCGFAAVRFVTFVGKGRAAVQKDFVRGGAAEAVQGQGRTRGIVATLGLDGRAAASQLQSVGRRTDATQLFFVP